VSARQTAGVELYRLTVEAPRGEPLVLVHGMGGIADLWRGVIASLGNRWPGPVVALDLPGHGRSPALSTYGPGGHAAAVADTLGRTFRPAAGPPPPVTVVGHSLGGLVGAMLASGWFGIEVRKLVAIGVKVRWTDEDLAASGALGERPARLFASRAEALERFVLVNGLRGVLDPDDEDAAGGVVEVEGGWRLAQDPRAFTADRPPVAELFAPLAPTPNQPARAVLACGSADAMVTSTEIAELGFPATVVDGAGHNAHVEAPDAVAELILAAASPERVTRSGG
jgi:pimeloyl-ACP methyl ester carboxylesterase